jgi:hypothetical protein
MVVAAEAFRLHNYYQLLLVPFASVLCGVGGLTAFTRLRDAAMSRQQRVTWAAGAALLALWTALAGGFFVADAARTDRRLTATGQQLQAVVGRGEAVVVVDRHPQSVLFAADRRGFHRSSTSFGEVLELERAGARFVFITETSTSFSDAGLVVQLQESRRLAARSHTWLLYALNPPADAAAAPSPAPSPTGTSDDDDSASDDDDSSIAPEAPTAPAD